MADDVQTGVHSAHARHGALQHLGAGAEQVEAGAGAFRQARHVVKEIGRCHALGQMMAPLDARGEHQRHAVGVDEVG
jgi:hypothetical protein